MKSNTENKPNFDSKRKSLVSFKEIPKILIQFGEKNPLLKDNKKFGNNKIVTTKYSIISWFPKSLLLQFNRFANLYFLMITILTFFPFSPETPGSTLATFVFVLILTMIKEAIQDYSRFKYDLLNNNKIVKKHCKGQWIDSRSEDLVPGDIIKVNKDEEASADILIISCSNTNGICYIDTKNLDGEIHLKEKICVELLKEINEDELSNIQGNIKCDAPNENLNLWEGFMCINDNMSVVTQSSLLLKGCYLKNIDYAIGIIIYTGNSTKIMKNNKKRKFKVTKIFHKMNSILYSIFLADIGICTSFSVYGMNWLARNGSELPYIYPEQSKSTLSAAMLFNLTKTLVVNMCTFLVSFQGMIPISLYVALDVVKIFQGIFIYYDDDIFDYKTNIPSNCKETDLIEELGQVDIMFCDKTGTLTQNDMLLKKCYVNGRIYEPESSTNFEETISEIMNMKLQSNETKDEEDREKLEDYFHLLTLCHSAFPEKNEKGEIKFQGSDPDEIALLKGAAKMGFVLSSKEKNLMTIINKNCDKESKFEVKFVIPFDHERKRMSVVVFNPVTREYILLSKGSDILLEFMNKKDNDISRIDKIIKVFSKQGLRVLIMGFKSLSEEFFNERMETLNHLKLINDIKEIEKIYNELEEGMILSGVSAIEDRLQDGVPETIFTFLTCNIRIWVLTGDKKETAEEIAKLCRLINDNLFLKNFCKQEEIEEEIDNFLKYYEIDLTPQNNFDKLLNLSVLKDEHRDEDGNLSIEEIVRRIKKKEGKDLSIIIDGVTLEIIFSDENLCKKFFRIALAAKSLVGCRMSPKQKANVIKTIKNNGNNITLSVGDGANDVPMIMEAHIGVGINGVEGDQAVRSADYSIGQFRFLEKLLLIYGRNGYVKVSKFICYYFYKNIILIFGGFFFTLYNGYSGQIYFAETLTGLFNAFFTSWPCVFTFSLEKDFDLSVVKSFPVLYEAGQTNYYFNTKVLWTYIFTGVIHSTLAFFIPCFGLAYTGIKEESSGWVKSTLSFGITIHIVSYKLLQMSEYWTKINIGSSIVSIVFYYVCMSILCWNQISKDFQPELTGIYYYIILDPIIWLQIILVPCLAMIIDISIYQVIYVSNPNPMNEIRSRLEDIDFRKHFLRNLDMKSERFNDPEIKNLESQMQDILKKHINKSSSVINTTKNETATKLLISSGKICFFIRW